MSAEDTHSSQYSVKGADIEKHPHHNGELPRTTVTAIEDLDDGVNRNTGFTGKLWKLTHRFDALGAESRGIERVLPEDRANVRTIYLLSGTRRRRIY